MVATRSTLSLDAMINDTRQQLMQGGMAGFCRAQTSLFQRHVRREFQYQSFRTRTNRCKAPLERVDDLVAYNALYAGRHCRALDHALLRCMPLGTRERTRPLQLNVVDYGCGQGLATLALLQYLAGRWVDLDLHLVEPSHLALHTARTLVEAYATKLPGRATMTAHHCGINALSPTFFRDRRHDATLHLFSNVLDLAGPEYFRLLPLLQTIRQTPGRHLCVAVGPRYSATAIAFRSLHREFGSHCIRVDDNVQISGNSAYATSHLQTGHIITLPNVKSRIIAARICNPPRMQIRRPGT